MDKLGKDIEAIARHLQKKQKSFDSVMDASRDIIRGAGQAITFVHNGKKAQALSLIKKLSALVKKTSAIDAQFRYHTAQAYQEYAEAAIFYSIAEKGTIPAYSKEFVEMESYLMGLMDVVGELKREVLERLRANDIDGAEKLYGHMKEVYDSTRNIRFAEAVLSGFRRKQDVARIQLEGAGSEILSASNARAHKTSR